MIGLRKRLRGLWRREEPRHAVDLVLPDGSTRTVEAEHRYTLVLASQTLETPIATHCPDGHCGECVVDVLGGDAALAPVADPERDAFQHGQGRPPRAGERLACHARVVGAGARVRVRRTWTLEGADPVVK